MAKHRRRSDRGTTAPALIAGVERARALVEKGRLLEAHELLLDLRRRYPPNQAVLGDLANLCLTLDDVPGCLSAIEELSDVRPDDPDVAMNLAAAYMKDKRYALSLLAFRDFLARWPEHHRGRDAREAIDMLESATAPMLEDLGLAGDEGLQAAALHEASQTLLARGEYAQARAAVEELLELRPGYEPALNNLSLAWLVEGRLDKAAEAARRVLDADPENVHALSNLIRFLVRSGEIEEAATFAERLKRVGDRPATDPFLKKAEAFSWLGDDEAVLEAFAAAEASGHLAGSAEGEAHLLHYAAVAAARTDRAAQAREYWGRAVDLSPTFKTAQENLDDFARLPEERHAPWAFDLQDWVRPEVLGRLVERMKSPSRRGERGVRNAMRAFLADEPGIAALVPVLFDRGDPKARELALRLAVGAGTPDTLEAARAFALSRRGPDAMRLEAANAARAAGLLPSAFVRFWTRGAWSEVALMGFEIHGEPEYAYAPSVERLARQAGEAIHAGEGADAERILRRALELAPGDTGLLYNLSMAMTLQEKAEDAEALVRQLHADHPDYLFARTTLAGLAVVGGRVEEARELLKPTLDRRRLHVSEFAALAGAWMNVHEAEGDLAGARRWLEMLREVYPEHPAARVWEYRLASGRRPEGKRR